MTNCPFCRELKADKRIIKNTKANFATLSDPRLVSGHTLVIPKRHVEYPGELTNDEITDSFGLIEEMRSKLIKSGLATGVDIRQNFRPFLAQDRLKIDHVHFHVLPRTNEDELYQKSMKFEKEIFDDLPESEFRQFTALLKD